jgi:prevent-host-death family protein
MATQWDISQAKDRIEELLSLARSGEEVVLSEGGHPVARVTPAERNDGPRLFGEFAGKIRMSDDFAEGPGMREEPSPQPSP